MIRKILITLIAACSIATAYAQQQCGTDRHYHEALKRNPALEDMERQFNRQLQQAIAARTTSVTDTTVYDATVVVHVIHDYGTENITDSSIYNAVNNWTTVFMKRNADTVHVIAPFQPWIGNTRLRLHLATKDPEGNPTKGITRTNSYLTKDAYEYSKIIGWPQDRYINIWLAVNIGGYAAGAGAYSQYPFAAVPDFDGVLCMAQYMNTDKIMPHELGHFLDLQHVWGNTNSPGVACGDDGVDDTPPTMGQLGAFCGPAELYDASCAAGYAKTYISASGLPDSVVNYPDTSNTQNMMNYMSACRIMYTKGQSVRMRTALLSPVANRSNLVTPATLSATGALSPMPDLAPIADFCVSKAISTSVVTDSRTYFLTCNNAASFNFKNWSWNDTLSGVQWTFSNGAAAPTSNAMLTVTNKFSVPGWVTVSLQATSNAGSNTITNTHAVYAADTVATLGVGYMQKFTNAAELANWPIFNVFNNQYKWQQFTGAGYDDGQCLRFRSYDTTSRAVNSQAGDHDEIYTPAFDLTTATSDLYANFYSAGAYNDAPGNGLANTNDSLELQVSVTGGQRWVKLGSWFGGNLANNNYKSSEFKPASPAQWVGRSVLIPSLYRTNLAFFRFKYWSGSTGNNTYIDNFSISPFTVGLEEAVAASKELVTIFPNPAANGCTLVFNTGNDGNVHYTIRDIAGRLVYERSVHLSPNTTHHEAISRDQTPAAGIYLVSMAIDGKIRTQKMVVY